MIDTENYYPRKRDGRIDEMEDGMTESRWVATQLGRPVVKAFNTMNYKYLLELGRPPGPGRLALPIAGDNARAKQIVLQLINELGFDGIDAGGLDDSWRQQPGTPVYDREFDSAGVRHAVAEARKERLPQWRATEVRPGSFRSACLGPVVFFLSSTTRGDTIGRIRVCSFVSNLKPKMGDDCRHE